MSESDVPPSGAGAETGPGTAPIESVPPEGVAFAAPEQPGDPPPAHPAAASVGPPPAVRPRRRGPLTRMGPWAPVAGALLGAVLGLGAGLFLAGTAGDFRERLSLVFLVVGMGLLGAS